MRRLLLTLVLAVAGSDRLAPPARAGTLVPVGAADHLRHGGVRRTLTADPGQWAPAATTYAYQWLRDGQPIGQATARDVHGPGSTTSGTRSR